MAEQQAALENVLLPLARVEGDRPDLDGPPRTPFEANNPPRDPTTAGPSRDPLGP